MRWWLLMSFVPLALGCASAPAPSPVASTATAEAEPPPASAANALGVVTLPAPGMPCFSGRQVDAGVEVLVFEDGLVPVARLTSTGEGCADEPADRQIDEALWHRTRLTGEGAGVATLAVGVVLADGVRADGNGAVELNGDSVVETFAACASSEGVHLTAWSGSMEEGRRLWHSYVYLGYDTEPTCSEAETQP